MPDRFIIVGAGPAGISISMRLLERGKDVLLIESGHNCPINHGSAVWWASRAQCSTCADKCLSEPQANLFGSRSVVIPIGRGVGGSSNINAMLWSRGHPHVFESKWPRGWSFEAMQPYFDRMEQLVGVTRVRPAGRLGRLVRDMFRRVQHTDMTHDGMFHVSMDGSHRIQLRDVLFSHAQNCPGTLTVRTGAHATRLIVDARHRAVIGVELASSTTHPSTPSTEPLLEQIFPEGTGEVVVCAGVVGSPELLRSSGIYPTPVTEGRKDAAVKADERKKGEREERKKVAEWKDHTMVPIIYMGLWGWSSEDDRLEQAQMPSPAGHNGVHALLNAYIDDAHGDRRKRLSFVEETTLASQRKIPHAQILLVDGRNAIALADDLVLPHWPRFWLWERCVRPILACLVRIVLAIPPVAWVVQHCTYAALVCNVSPGDMDEGDDGDGAGMGRCYNAPGDRERILAVVDGVRSLLAASNAIPWAFELLPGPLLHVLRPSAFVALFQNSYYHPVGSLPMGSGVDSALRPKGYRGVRVVDASIFPAVPSGPPTAVIMAVARRAADIILGKAKE